MDIETIEREARAEGQRLAAIGVELRLKGLPTERWAEYLEKVVADAQAKLRDEEAGVAWAEAFLQGYDKVSGPLIKTVIRTQRHSHT